MIDIKKESKKYLFHNWAFILGAFFLLQIYDHVVGSAYGTVWAGVTIPALVSASFFFFFSTVIGCLWRWLETSHKEILTSFFLAVSGFRMLLSLIVLGIVYAIVGRDAMLPYVLVFFVFYIITTGYHSIFFARLNNKK